MKNILMKTFILFSFFFAFVLMDETNVMKVYAEERPPVVEETEYTIKCSGAIYIPYNSEVYKNIKCDTSVSGYLYEKVDKIEGYIYVSDSRYNTKEYDDTLTIYTEYGETVCKIHVRKIFAFDSNLYELVRGEGDLAISEEISEEATISSSDENVVKIEYGKNNYCKAVAVDEGTAIITATNSKGEVAYATINVYVPEFTINGETNPDVGVEIGYSKKFELPSNSVYRAEDCTYEVETPGYIMFYKQSGKFYAEGIKLGNTKVTITNPYGQKVECNIHVYKDIDYDSLQFKNLESEYFLGSKYKLEGTYTPEDANIKLEFSTYGRYLDRVDITEDGWLIPKQEGIVSVKIGSQDVSDYDYEELWIRNPYFEYKEYNDTKYLIYKNEVLKTVLKGENEVTKYTSSNPEIVTVDENGVITGISAGTAKITADTNGYVATAKVEVRNPKLDKESVNIYPNESAVLSVEGAVGEIVWKSSNTNVAVVSANGKITPKNVGSAIISANVSGESLKCKVTVKKPYLSKQKVELYPNGSQTLSVKGTKSTAKWTSSNTKVVKVSSGGKLTPVAPGKATITTKVNGVSLKCQVTIKSPEISNNKKTLIARETFKLKIKGSKGTIKWSSSNKSVATINSSGKITAKKAGNATITGKVNGKKLTCKVTVKKNQITYSVDTDPNSYNYGEPAVVLKKAYYDGKKIVAEAWIINNRMFYANKFDWLRYKLYDYNGKLIASKKFKNVKLNIKPYGAKKITLTFSGDAVKTQSALLNKGVSTDWSFVYTYSY